MLRKFKSSASVVLIMCLLLSVFPQAIFASPASSSKDILSFSLEGNPGIIDNNNHTIQVVVPYRSAVYNMFEIFTVSDGAHVTNHTSNVTSTDYTTPVVLTVVAEDLSTQDYLVSVIIGPSNLKSILSFNLSNLAVTGFIDDEAFAIYLTVPQGTDVTGLKPTFITDDGAAKVKVNGIVQTSGVTLQDFTQPLTYTVEALDGSTRNYLVTVNEQKVLSTAKEFTYFGFSSLSAIGYINELSRTISFKVPYGTDLTKLVPVFEHTGTRVTTNGGWQQISGEEVTNFTSPNLYVVYDESGDSAGYTVTVNHAPQEALATKEILSFSIAGAPGIVDEATHTISVMLPAGMDRNNQKASFTTNGDQVTVENNPQVSGVTVNNFTSPLIYTVLAEDGLTQKYTVTVTRPKELLEFNLTYPVQVTGLINQVNKTISLDIPYGTDLSLTKASHITTGDHIEINGVIQQSGITESNLSQSPIINVIDSENVASPYTLIINMGLNPAKEVTSFSINGVAGTYNNINGDAYSIELPYGTDVTALVPTFTATGDHVEVGSVTQISGVSTQNFTNSVIYKVTAADGTSKNYTVTVTLKSAPTPTPTPTPTSTTTPTPTPTPTPTSTTTPTPTPTSTTTPTPTTSTTPTTAPTPTPVYTSITVPTPTPIPIPTPTPTPTPTPALLYNQKVDLDVVKAIVEKAKTASALVFVDVTKESPNVKAIELATKLGIITGYSDASFHADATVTRAEFATMLSKAFGLQITDQSNFKDVKEHWASDAILRLKASGITSGYLDGTFKPNKFITRAEIAALLSAVINPNLIKKAEFKDVSGHWAEDEINLLFASGIVKGTDNGLFKPNANATRSETLLLILRMLNIGLDFPLEIE